MMNRHVRPAVIRPHYGFETDPDFSSSSLPVVAPFCFVIVLCECAFAFAYNM